MFSGVMYQDTSKKSAEDKIQHILTQYQTKVGHPPEIVMVNSDTVLELEDITVKHAKFVMPNNFWLGTE